LKVSDEHREILRRYIVGRLGLSEGAA
jgi:hypothetical protein